MANSKVAYWLSKVITFVVDADGAHPPTGLGENRDDFLSGGGEVAGFPVQGL
jgi:hypothetical protein